MTTSHPLSKPQQAALFQQLADQKRYSCLGWQWGPSLFTTCTTQKNLDPDDLRARQEQGEDLNAECTSLIDALHSFKLAGFFGFAILYPCVSFIARLVHYWPWQYLLSSRSLMESLPFSTQLAFIGTSSLTLFALAHQLRHHMQPHADEATNALVTLPRMSHRLLCAPPSDDPTESNLEEALGRLNTSWLLYFLDHSWNSVRNTTKTPEDHQRYFSGLLKIIRQRSRLYHSDKHPGSSDNMQKMIGSLLEALPRLHEYIVGATPVERAPYRECSYQHFASVPLKLLASETSLTALLETTPQGQSRLQFFWDISRKEENELTQAYNQFLTETRALLDSLPNPHTLPQAFKTLYTTYTQAYRLHWVQPLESWVKRTSPSPLRAEMKALRDDARTQLHYLDPSLWRQLFGLPTDALPDPVFVDPVLQYQTCISLVAIYLGHASLPVTEPSPDRQEAIRTWLYSMPLSELLNTLYVHFIYTGSSLGTKPNFRCLLTPILTESVARNLPDTERKSSVYFLLRQCVNRLSEQYPLRETFEDRQHKKEQLYEKRRRDLEDEITRLEAEYQQAKQARQQAQMRADRAELIIEITRRFTRALRKLPETLVDAIETQENACIEAIAQRLSQDATLNLEAVVTQAIQILRQHQQALLAGTLSDIGALIQNAVLDPASDLPASGQTPFWKSAPSSCANKPSPSETPSPAA